MDNTKSTTHHREDMVGMSEHSRQGVGWIRVLVVHDQIHIIRYDLVGPKVSLSIMGVPMSSLLQLKCCNDNLSNTVK